MYGGNAVSGEYCIASIGVRGRLSLHARKRSGHMDTPKTRYAEPHLGTRTYPGKNDHVFDSLRKQPEKRRFYKKVTSVTSLA